MVTRKPVPASSNTASVPVPSSAASPPAPALPYPSTPPKHAASIAPSGGNSNTAGPAQASGFDLIDMGGRSKLERRDSDVSSHGTWDSDDADEEAEQEEDFVSVPKPLNIRPSQQNLNANRESLPAILRPGPTGTSPAVTPQRSPEIQQYDAEAQENPWQLESNNPFRRENGFLPPVPSASSPAQSFGAVQPPPPQPQAPSQPPPPPPLQAPPPPPPQQPPQSTYSGPAQPPTDSLAELSIAEMSADPASPPFKTAEVLPVPQKGQPPFPSVTRTSTGDAPPFPSSNPWRTPSFSESDTHTYFPPATAPPAPPLPAPSDDRYQPPAALPPAQAGPLIDHEEPAQASTTPQAPPRLSTTSSQAPVPQSSESSPDSQAKRQRNEHYQIKQINWYDRTAIRRSPILTQNANGPCPLLALVNALVLSTPSTLDTALIDTLRSREQVSLGLLLDAVFDELMSGRRGNTAHELPDVSDLYSFLLALHTGMNVNPRFVPRAGHSRDVPGGFEETREMRLYSTFNVPLIHGWIPPSSSPAYAAFERSAQTFEDAQNIQFVEPELEDKRQNEGLGPEEQQSLYDIQNIKQFLNNWPTQLTEHGLDMISRGIAPGQIAILFRNDHFSTVYKEPNHGALMTLVTDAGYSSHEEIVWESLVDVNGAASELFSGDFRLVSHSDGARLNQSSSAGGEDGWQTVQSRQRQTQQQQTQQQQQQTNTPPSFSPAAESSTSAEVPPSLPGPRPILHSDDDNAAVMLTDDQRKAAEQEDHDLALALQLQEEEEDRQRQDEERRRREQELSEQFLENEERPPVPPRRNNGTTTNTGRTASAATAATAASTSATTTSPPATATMSRRPAVNRPADSAESAPPPSYEQAAADQPYRPAGTHAGSAAQGASGGPLNAYDALRRQQSAYTQQSSDPLNAAGGPAAPPYSPGGYGQGRRRSDGNRGRRRSSGFGSYAPSSPTGAGPSAGPGRMAGAATVRDAQDERCVLM